MLDTARRLWEHPERARPRCTEPRYANDRLASLGPTVGRAGARKVQPALGRWCEHGGTGPPGEPPAQRPAPRTGAGRGLRPAVLEGGHLAVPSLRASQAPD